MVSIVDKHFLKIPNRNSPKVNFTTFKPEYDNTNSGKIIRIKSQTDKFVLRLKFFTKGTKLQK